MKIQDCKNAIKNLEKYYAPPTEPKKRTEAIESLALIFELLNEKIKECLKEGN